MSEMHSCVRVEQLLLYFCIGFIASVPSFFVTDWVNRLCLYPVFFNHNHNLTDK